MDGWEAGGRIDAAAMRLGLECMIVYQSCIESQALPRVYAKSTAVALDENIISCSEE